MFRPQFSGADAVPINTHSVIANRTFNCEWVREAIEVVTSYIPNGTDWQVHWQNQAHPDDNTSVQNLWLQLLPGEKEVQKFRVEVISD